MSKMPHCPMCKRTTDVVVSGDKNHFCGRCKVEFNHDPATDRFFNRNPERHAEKQENYEQRKRQQFGQRR